MAPVLIVVAVVLVQAMNRQDRLIAALAEQAAVDPLTGLVTRHVLADDPATASVDARPPTGRDTLAPLSHDHLLNAIGCCGLRPPRRVGERHL